MEVVEGVGGWDRGRKILFKGRVDELAMQGRVFLALHVASDPGLALDIMVFTLVDADTHDWRARAATTLRAPVPAGPSIGFEAKDAPASRGLAAFRPSLDARWRDGYDSISPLVHFWATPDVSSSAWLRCFVARAPEAGP